MLLFAQGSALVLLYPSEEAYVDFLAINQKVRLKEIKLESPDKHQVEFYSSAALSL